MLRASDQRLAYHLLVRVANMHQPRARWAMLDHAELPEELVNELRYEGSAAEFVTDVLRRCAERGGDGPRLLAGVLSAAAQFVGVDKKAELVALADRLVVTPQAADRTITSFLDELALRTATDGLPSAYAALDRLFVAPAQYQRIRQILDEHHAVIILGDPHVGKTYCAVHLLWDLFRKTGRLPRWISLNQLSEALQSPGGTFELQVKQLLGNGTAVYLEDPFGTTAPVDMRDFVNNLKVFFRYVREADVRVVITSRSYVFGQVIPDLFDAYVVTLSQELNLDVSYHQGDLIDIATRYMNEYGVAWRADADQRVIAKIVGELHAPHNIEFFLRATKSTRSLAEAVAELPAYRDVTGQFALMIREKPLWLQGFLCVVYFFTNHELADRVSRRLFEDALAAGDLGQATLASWERAEEELAAYLTTRKRFDDSFATLRHPSIEDAFDQRVRADAGLREVVRRLLARAMSSPHRRLHLPAFRCFVHYSDLFWGTPWGQTQFHRMLADGDTYIRETTRLYVIEESRRLPEHQCELLHAHAEREWNDRFLLRLLIGAPVAEQRKIRLVNSLIRSWDDWIRYQLACAVIFVMDEPRARSVLEQFLTDQSPTVARAAVTSLLTLIARPDPSLARVKRIKELVPEKLYVFFDAEAKRIAQELGKSVGGV